MKKFIITLLLIIVIGLGTGAYFLMRSLNSQTYQQQIIQSISQMTGRKMTVSGKTTLKWMPMPTLVMTGVYLSNQAGSDKTTMLSADSLQVQIEWNSLFKTPLVVKNIELVKPVLYLERLESNRANWDFPFFSAPDEILNDTQLLGTQNTADQMKIDRLNIKGGTIQYTNKITQTSMELQNINGTLTVDALKGPYTFNGSAYVNKTPLIGTFNVGKIRNDMPATVTAQIQEKSAGLTLDFTGQIIPYDPKTTMTGDGSFTIKNPTPLWEMVGIDKPNSLMVQEAVGNFGLDITPLKDTLKNMTIRFGSGDGAFAMTATVSHTPQTATAKQSWTGDVAVNSFDYQAFKPYLNTFNWSAFTSGEKHPDVSFNIHIPLLRINNADVQGVEAALTYKNHQLTLKNGKALLPGNTQTSFSADSGMQGQTPYILIYTQAKTSDLKTLLPFININGQTDNPKILKQAEVDARITWAPGFVSVLLNDLQVDAVKATGSVDFATDGKQKWAVDLNVDNLNIDTYTNWQPTTDKTALNTLPALFQKTLSQSAFNKSQIRFKTTFKALTWHNLPFTNGALAGSFDNGSLKLTNLEFNDTATASLKASADISGIGSPAVAIGALTFNFSAQSFPLFMERAGLTSDLPFFQKASTLRFNGTVSGKDNHWKTNVLLQASEAAIKVNGGLTFINDEPRFQEINFNIIHPNFQRLLTLMNLPNTYTKNLDGALRAQGTINGAPQDLQLTHLDASVGIQRLSGDVTYQNQGIKKLTARLTSPAFDAARFVPNASVFFDGLGKFSNKPFDFSPLDNWDIAFNLSAGRLTYKVIDLSDAHLAFTIKDKLLTLTDFSGTQKNADKARFKTTGTLSWVSEPVLKAALELADIPIRSDFMIVNKFSYGGGKLALKGDFNAIGKSAAALIASLSGKGTAAFTNGQFLGVDLSKITPLVKQALNENMPQETFDAQMNRLTHLGKTPVNSIQGAFSIAKGVVRFMDMTVTTPTTTAAPSQIVWNIPTYSVEISMPVTLNAYRQLPPLLMNISMDGSRKIYTPDYTDLSNVLSGTIKKELDDLSAQTKAAEIQQQQAALSARQKLIKEAVLQANTVVKQTAQELQSSGNEQSGVLMQNALDALSIVNQLAIKEQLTTDQENTLLEQARLSILKANEAKQTAASDGMMDHRQTVALFESKANAMLKKMIQLQKDLPQIAIIPRMVNQATQNLNTIHQVRLNLAQSDQAGQASLLAEASDAFDQLESAYENVMRFDSEMTAQPSKTPGGTIRGTISRKGMNN